MNSPQLETQRSEAPVETHLENALDNDDPAEKNYHIRAALQHLVAKETGSTPRDVSD